MLPTCFMPLLNRRLPPALSTIVSASRRAVPSEGFFESFMTCRRRQTSALLRASLVGRQRLPRVLPALRAQPEKCHGLLIESRALVAIPQRFANDPPDDPWSEIVRVVEPVHRRHHFGTGEFGIGDVWRLMTAAVGHRRHCEEALPLDLVVQLRPRIGVGERD